MKPQIKPLTRLIILRLIQAQKYASVAALRKQMTGSFAKDVDQREVATLESFVRFLLAEGILAGSPAHLSLSKSGERLLERAHYPELEEVFARHSVSAVPGPRASSSAN